MVFQNLFQRAPKPRAASFGDFASLTPDSLDRFVDHHRRKDGLWVFHHIPKTAGSSLANEIARRRTPYRNINVSGMPSWRGWWLNIGAATDRFFDENAETRFRSASGHLRQVNLDKITEHIPGTRLLTFVRHPVARLVSDYRYTRTPAHPNWQKVIADVPNFDAYLKQKYSHNKMARFMFGDREVPADEAAEMVLHRYNFVGVQELYGLSFTLLSTLLWEPQGPGLRKRVTEERPENKLELTPGLEARVLELNQVDLAIYTAARQHLEALAERVTVLPPEPAAGQ